MAVAGSCGSCVRVTCLMLPPDDLAGPDPAPAPDAVAVIPAPAIIELCLQPEDLCSLLRLPGLVRIGRAAGVRTLWYDTGTGAVSEAGFSLAETGPVWRMEALRPAVEQPWPPLSPAPLLAEGESAVALGYAGRLTPIAGLEGLRRRFSLETGTALFLTVLDAELRGVAASERACRVWLEGDRTALAEVACRLAAQLRLTVPLASLASEAAAVASGQAVSARHLGGPTLLRGHSLSDSIALILGQLLDVILHWADPAAAGLSAAPVHQMRVAIRRLRSALSIFGPALSCPALTEAVVGLKELASRLGYARDWDVFLAGTGSAMSQNLPADRRIKALLAACARRRALAYAELRAHLAAPAFRVLQVQLGCAATLRPWESAAAGHGLHQDTAAFATTVLTRRWKRVRRAGRGMAALDAPALHELRKDCKRLRYAAEFFQPFFPEKAGNRFLKHLTALQEALGVLNDGTVAAGLMAQLGRAERGYAAGLVQGFVLGGTQSSRAKTINAWAHFRGQRAFWLK